MLKIFFLLISLIKITLSQLNPIQIGQSLEETIDKTKYYMITLDQELISQSPYLVIYVHPSDNYEEYSDPDLYISTKNNNPNSYYNSEWRSTHLGRDIVTIPTQELKNSTYLYIGIECLKICKYELDIELEKSVELSLDQVGMITFSNETSSILTYKHNYNISNVFEIFSIGTRTSDFKMNIYHVGDNGQDSEISVFTSWDGGYSALIDSDDNDCKKCYYKIVFSCKPYSQVIIGVRRANVTTNIIPMSNVWGSLSETMTDCYKFDSDRVGDYLFYANAYRSNFMVNIKIDPSSSSSDDSFIFTSDITMKFNYSQIFNKYICISEASGKNQYYASYNILLFKEDDIELFDGFYLASGVPMKGYLPKGKTTIYFPWRNAKDEYKTMTMNMKAISGSPKLYGYFCNNPPCKMNLEAAQNNPNMIKPLIIGQDSSLLINSVDNFCSQSPETCHTIMIIGCEGDIECQYTVTVTIQDEIEILQEK